MVYSPHPCKLGCLQGSFLFLLHSVELTAERGYVRMLVCVCVCVLMCTCAVKLDEEGWFQAWLALSLVTHKTMGKSLHFWTSHLQGVSGSPNGDKQPG